MTADLPIIRQMQTDRLDPTIKRAYELARSGDHLSALTVEKALITEGYTDAPVALFGKAIRNAITRLCREAAGLPALQIGRRRKAIEVVDLHVSDVLASKIGPACATQK